MKFLLVAINAKYIHSNPAVYSLKASAGDRISPYVEIAEYTVNQRTQDILADLYERQPDWIGFSCYIWNWDLVRELVAEIPKILPKAAIWLGGPQVSFDAERILEQLPELSGILVGEGEDTFRELAERYLEKACGQVGEPCLTDVPGLCLPEGFTPSRAPLDLSGLPFLYGEDSELSAFSDRILYYESGRGCPFRCSYCLSSVEKTLRFRDVEKVKRELQFFLDRRVKQVKFVDRTFNCNHDHAIAIWRYISEHDNGVTNFHFEVAGDLFLEEELELLSRMRPGLVQLEIGVQSVNPDTLRAIRRVMDLERLEEVTARIRAGGNVHQHLDLIAGLPFEDYASFGVSFDRVWRMRPNQLQLGFLKVLKGTPMEAQAKEYGLRYTDRPPYEVLCTNWLSYRDVRRLKGVEEMVEIFYNSGQFLHTIRFLEQAFERPFSMFEALADAYRAANMAERSVSRLSRYQFLFGFVRERDGEFADAYRELLTHDWYLRESGRSRPDFAAALTEEEKGWIRSFYQAEEKNRSYLAGYEAYDWKQLSRMTHLERFCYPVWDEEGMKRVREGARSVPCRVLYDYALRDALDGSARTRVLRDSAPSS